MLFNYSSGLSCSVKGLFLIPRYFLTGKKSINGDAIVSLSVLNSGCSTGFTLMSIGVARSPLCLRLLAYLSRRLRFSQDLNAGLLASDGYSTT